VVLDRISRLIDGLDIAEGQGLEIGPLFSPILRRPQANVFYVDHADTETLRQKYASDPNVPEELIVPIDFVWNGEKLETVTDNAEFDYVIASHVIEHVPDVLNWISELGSVSKDDGSLRLIVPDRRFTFDLQRQESGILDVLAAAIEKRKTPAPRDILDFWTKYQSVDCELVWAGQNPAHSGLHLEELPGAMQRAREAFEQGAYHDTHCWVFTPMSFAALMSELAQLKLISFACSYIYPTAPNELDFFVHMTKSDDPIAIASSWAEILEMDLDRTGIELATAI
jgi:SAM-dependent methyltransferase